MNLLEQQKATTTQVDPSKSVANTYDLNAAAGPAKDPAKLEVNDQMLASKQLDGILAKDNPLFQKARARASAAANARGLLNSSIAVGAGESAMIDAALPLAQQDASTYANAAQFNAGASNDFARDSNSFGRQGAMAKFGHLAGLEESNANRDFQSNQNLLERQFRTSERVGQQEFAAAQEGLNRQFQMDFEKFKLPMNMMSGFQERMQTYVSQVMSDPNMDAAAKDQAIKNYYAYSQQTMGWMSQFFGAQMPNMSGGPNIGAPVTGTGVQQPGGVQQGGSGVGPGADIGVPPPTYAPPVTYAPAVATSGAGTQAGINPVDEELRYTGDQYERFNRTVNR